MTIRRYVTDKGYPVVNLEASHLPTGMSFLKHDDSKLKFSLLPIQCIEDILQVLMHGADKYGIDNWKKCEDLTRYSDALERHLTAWKKGELIDSDSGLTHLSHLACNALFLLYLEHHNEIR